MDMTGLLFHQIHISLMPPDLFETFATSWIGSEHVNANDIPHFEDISQLLLSEPKQSRPWVKKVKKTMIPEFPKAWRDLLVGDGFVSETDKPSEPLAFWVLRNRLEPTVDPLEADNYPVPPLSLPPLFPYWYQRGANTLLYKLKLPAQLLDSLIQEVLSLRPDLGTPKLTLVKMANHPRLSTLACGVDQAVLRARLVAHPILHEVARLVLQQPVQDGVSWSRVAADQETVSYLWRDTAWAITYWIGWLVAPC
jgi:hypothetical protein